MIRLEIPTMDSDADNLLRILLDSQTSSRNAEQISEWLKRRAGAFAVVHFDIDQSKRLRDISVNFKVAALETFRQEVEVAAGRDALVLSEGTRDELTIILPLRDEENREAAVARIERLRSTARVSYDHGSSPAAHALTVTAGISFMLGSESIRKALLKAKSAASRAKKRGGDSHELAAEADLRMLEIAVPWSLAGNSLVSEEQRIQHAIELICECHSGLEVFCNGVDDLARKLGLLNEKPFTILIAGPPGAGKSSISHILRKRVGARSFAVRLRLEALRERQDALASRIDAFQRSNPDSFIPDDFITAMMVQFFDEVGPTTPVVLEGVPINEGQAITVRNVAAQVGRTVDLCVFVEAPVDILRDRVANRKVCPRCERRAQAGVPILEPTDICQNCGGPLVVRDDDVLSQFEKRTETYIHDRELISRMFGDVPQIKLDTSHSPPSMLADRVLATHLSLMLPDID